MPWSTIRMSTKRNKVNKDMNLYASISSVSGDLFSKLSMEKQKLWWQLHIRRNKLSDGFFFVCARFNCIFVYSLLASCWVRAGVFLGRLEGGAVAAALDGGGAAALGGQGGGPGRDNWVGRRGCRTAVCWLSCCRMTEGIDIGLGWLGEEVVGVWFEGAKLLCYCMRDQTTELAMWPMMTSTINGCNNKKL